MHMCRVEHVKPLRKDQLLAQVVTKRPQALKVDLTVNKDVLDRIEKLQQEGGCDFEVSFVL